MCPDRFLEARPSAGPRKSRKRTKVMKSLISGKIEKTHEMCYCHDFERQVSILYFYGNNALSSPRGEMYCIPIGLLCLLETIFTLKLLNS